jgi:hypothetical protein
MLYIALLLFGTVVSILGLIDRIMVGETDNPSLAVIVLTTCIMWAGFIVYYLN